jgi:hypothetical protein
MVLLKLKTWILGSARHTEIFEQHKTHSVEQRKTRSLARLVMVVRGQRSSSSYFDTYKIYIHMAW